MAYLVNLVMSPDLDELCAAIGKATDTITVAGMNDDPQVVALVTAIVERVTSGRAFDMATQANGDVVFSIADDELLDLLAKWQAMKQVAIARLQARGWRT